MTEEEIDQIVRGSNTPREAELRFYEQLVREKLAQGNKDVELLRAAIVKEFTKEGNAISEARVISLLAYVIMDKDEFPDDEDEPSEAP